MAWVICERERVIELAADLAAEGVEVGTPMTTEMSIDLRECNVSFLGMCAPPGAAGRVFSLHAPVEGVDRQPEWVEYGRGDHTVGWNYTRDLAAFRVTRGQTSSARCR